MRNLPTGNLWQLTRRFLAECTAAFVANFAIMYHDHTRKYEPFVSGLLAGSVVYCAIFTTFVICGAQINPMTTLAVILSRRMSIIYVPMYLIAQMAGTLLSLYIGLKISPFVANRTHVGMPMPGPGVTDLQAIGMEIIITFFLELAIVALLDELRLPSFHPMNRINAFVLLVMVFFWIDLISLPISGACTNPARSLASVIINFNFERQYIYLIGPPIGSALSVMVQEIFLSPDASKARLIGLFNYRKVFNRREFYGTPPTSNLPPQTQNANVGLEYFRTTTTLSTLSVKSAISGTDFTRLHVRSVFPISSDSRWSRESRGSFRVILTKPSDERNERRRI